MNCYNPNSFLQNAHFNGIHREIWKKRFVHNLSNHQIKTDSKKNPTKCSNVLLLHSAMVFMNHCLVLLPITK